MPISLNTARRSRWLNLAIANLRILLGFAFLPSGLKKVLDQPFTDPAKTGAFHEFLHAFQATGLFYQFVGAVQLTIAVLLMTQTFATLGALLALPVFTAITVFCWSTHAWFTAAMATLMLGGTVILVMWDFDRWRDVLRAVDARIEHRTSENVATLPVDSALWRRCGLGILAVYLASCGLSGGIYRPRGVELGNPAFYIFPLIAVIPIATFAIERARYKAR